MQRDARRAAWVVAGILVAFSCAAGPRTRPPAPTAQPMAPPAPAPAHKAPDEPQLSPEATFHFIRASALLEQGDAPGAAAAVREAMVFDHRSAVLHAFLSEALLRQGRHGDALSEANRALELDDNSVEGHAARAAALWDAQHMDEAAAALEEVVRRAPGRVSEASRLMDLRVRKGDIAGARKVSAALVRARDEDGAVLVLLAALCEQHAAWECAAAELDAAARKAPRSVEICTMQAELLERQARTADTAGAWERCAALEPSSETLEENLLVALARAGRTDELGRRLAAIGGRRDVTAARIAALARRLSDTPAIGPAEQLVRSGLVRFGDGAELNAALGSALARQGRCEDADRALRSGGSASDVIGERASCHLRRRDPRAAVELFAKTPAARDDPKLRVLRCRAFGDAGNATEPIKLAALPVGIGVPATLVESRCLLAGRRPDEALAATMRLLSKSPDDPSLLMMHALVQWEAGRHKEAVGTLRSLLAVRPDDVEASNFLAYAILETRGSSEEALALARAAAARLPSSGAIADTLGAALLATGKPAEAIAMFDKALLFQPHDAEIWLHLGDARRAAGRKDARQAWESGLALLPLERDVADALRARLGAR